MTEVLFFRTCDGAKSSVTDVSDSGSIPQLEVWTPSRYNIRPRGLGFLPYALWWVFHWSGVFRNDSYRVFLLRENGTVVHRSCVFAPYFRFPFMAPGDVQVGDVWTAQSRRGSGVATAVVRQITREFAGTCVWFLCESGNVASARLAQAAGMQLYGVGVRESRWGISMLGRFRIRTLA